MKRTKIATILITILIHTGLIFFIGFFAGRVRKETEEPVITQNTAISFWRPKGAVSVVWDLELPELIKNDGRLCFVLGMIYRIHEHNLSMKKRIADNEEKLDLLLGLCKLQTDVIEKLTRVAE